MFDASHEKFFVRINGKILGPFEIDQLRSLRDRGRLHATHEISPDRKRWEPAARLESLFTTAAASTVTSTAQPAARGNFSDDPPEREAQAAIWFYSRNGSQLGPVSKEMLRQLAREGSLKPNDLIWREGLAEWISARDEAGLFSEKEGFTFGAEPDRAEWNATGGTHPQTILWDLFLSAVRDQVTPRGLEASMRHLVQAGGLAMSLSMIMALVYLITESVKLDSIRLTLESLGVAIVISILKYIGIHISRSGDILIRSSSNDVSSRAFVNVVSVILLFLGVATAGSIIYWGVALDSLSEKLRMFSGATVSLLVLGFSAFAALHPQWLNIKITPGARAGQEGIALCSFLLKLNMRLATVNFGVCAILGAGGFLAAAVCQFVGGEWASVGVDWFEIGRGGTLLAGLVPLFAYLLFVFCSIILDVAQSIILLPQQPGGDNPGE